MSIAGVLLIAFAQLAGAAAPVPAETRQSPLTRGEIADSARLKACESLAQTSPEKAYEEGRAWTAESPAFEAKYCLAAAAYAQNRPLLAAEQFEAVARGMAGRDKIGQARAQSDSGNAWLIAGDGARALAAFDRALGFAPGDTNLLIDRARGYAYLRDWRHSEEDLNAVLAVDGQDPLALRLRAETRLQLGARALALKDAEAAHAIDANDVETLLVLGRIKEAIAGR